jgi:hypothetical protein
MILFLDFDVVLHPDPPTQELSLWCRSDVLCGWLNAHSQVEDVISSTWRVGRTLDKRLIPCRIGIGLLS